MFGNQSKHSFKCLIYSRTCIKRHPIKRSVVKVPKLRPLIIVILTSMKWSGTSIKRSRSPFTKSQRAVSIGVLRCRHVGVQNKRKFVHEVCIKMEVNSQRRKILLFLNTNMAAMTSHANHKLF